MRKRAANAISDVAGDDFSETPTTTGATLSYDANGSQQSVTSAESTFAHDWDFEGHLTSVSDGTNQTLYTYDAGGQRLKTTSTSDGINFTTRRYLVDENTAYAQVLEEYDDAGAIQARYVYGLGFGPLWMQRRQKNAQNVEETRTRYLLADGHGSIRQLMDETGAITDSHYYDAWGNALSGGSGNTINPYRYNGQQLDADGKYYLRARYYNAGTGRFLSHDPILGNSDDPVTLHRYLYANADGVNYVDPSGEMANSQIAAIGIGAILAAAYVGHVYSYNYNLQYRGGVHVTVHGEEISYKKIFTRITAGRVSQAIDDAEADTLFDALGRWSGKSHAFNLLEQQLENEQIKLYTFEDNQLAGLHSVGFASYNIYVSKQTMSKGPLAIALVIYAEWQHSTSLAEQEAIGPDEVKAQNNFAPVVKQIPYPELTTSFPSYPMYNQNGSLKPQEQRLYHEYNNGQLMGNVEHSFIQSLYHGPGGL